VTQFFNAASETFKKLTSPTECRPEDTDGDCESGLDVSVGPEFEQRQMVKKLSSSLFKDKMSKLAMIKKTSSNSLLYHQNHDQLIKSHRRKRQAQSFVSQIDTSNYDKIEEIVPSPLMQFNQRTSFDIITLLPAPLDADQFTLILDLDETLVHFDSYYEHFRVRPYCRTFLAQMSKIFEIVIFTAACEDYANFILNQLDPQNKLIQHRLYRQHCTFSGRVCVKDLARLGRPLSKCIIVDNLKENFMR
jgi:TFIIF-interacting CTD phosphatase-like protein